MEHERSHGTTRACSYAELGTYHITATRGRTDNSRKKVRLQEGLPPIVVYQSAKDRIEEEVLHSVKHVGDEPCLSCLVDRIHMEVEFVT